MQYKIVTASSVQLLEAAVIAAIEDGWSPLGGIAPIVDDSQGLLAQAMTKTA